MSDADSTWLALELPPGIELVDGPAGLRIRGNASEVADAAESLRSLKDRGEGATVIVGSWSLVVSEFIPEERLDRTVMMPSHAWNIAASVLGDVAYGEYDSPFDFGDVGYLSPRADPDIGVEFVGPTLVRSFREVQP